MKKVYAAILAILTAALVLVSCNVDGEHGLYNQLATSVPSSGLRIVNYLYHDSGTHWFLTDNGVYSTTTASGGTSLLEGTEGKFITGAWVENSASFYMLDTYSKLCTSNGSSVSDPVNTDYTGLSNNGYFYNTSKFKYKYSGSDVTVTMPYTPLFSGYSMLAKTSETTATIYYAGAEKFTISGIFNVKNITGFQEVAADTYLVFYSSKAYTVTANIADFSSATSAFSVSGEAPTGGYKTVLCDSDKVLLRSKQSFYLIDTSSSSIERVSWISALNNVDVVEMYLMGGRQVAVATYENGIHIVDMSANTVSSDIL